MNPSKLTLLALATLLTGCSFEGRAGDLPAVDDVTRSVSRQLAPPPTGARYFGYFGSHWISGPVPDCTDPAFSDHTNVWWIYANSPAGVNLAQIQTGAACGHRSILAGLQQMFFTDGFTLKPDPEGTAAALRARLDPQLSNIVALFTFDEPFIQVAPSDKARLKADIERMHAALKRQFPGVPLALNFSAPELVPGHPAQMPGIPADTDWVGFDCYLDAGSYGSCASRSIPEHLAALKARMSPGQRLFLVPPAFVTRQDPAATAQGDCGSHRLASEQVGALEAFVDAYTQLALSEPLVIGVFPYVWASYCDGGRWYTAARELPTVLSRFQAQGAAIISRPSMYVDAPGNGATVSGTFAIGGWAIDQRAFSGTGVDAIDVWAYPNTGAAPLYVGPAQLGGNRPDIVAAFERDQFLPSGFDLRGSLPPGGYNLAVFARSAMTHSFNDVQVIAINVPDLSCTSYPMPFTSSTDPLVFDCHFYLQTYADLRSAFGTDCAAAARHWVASGISEGRSGSALLHPVDYLARYPDLRAAFDHDYAGAVRHFVTFGRCEGRVGN